MHHTQLKYIRRLEFCEDKLKELNLDQLNAERFGASMYSPSRVLVQHKMATKFEESMYDSVKSSVQAVVKPATPTGTPTATGKEEQAGN